MESLIITTAIKYEAYVFGKDKIPCLPLRRRAARRVGIPLIGGIKGG